jgi:amino-acid N-acetyltransferase
MHSHTIEVSAMLALRKPRLSDVPAMHSLMEPLIRSEALLPRTPRAIVEHLRDYTLAVDEDDQVVGLASLSLVEVHLAELGAVVCQQPELMATLVSRVLEEAREIGVQRVFVLAPETDAYEALGFHSAEIADLPEKRDRQCLRCPRLPRCRQVALVQDL